MLNHRIDRLGNGAVLIHRFGKIDHVVCDDVRTGAGQFQDARREVRLAVEGGVKQLAAARREIVHDLHHRTVLVGAGCAERFFLEHDDAGRQVVAGDVAERAAEAVEAVRENTDGDAAAVD